MAVIYINKEYLERKTELKEEEIIEILNKLGFPTEVEEEYIVEVTPNRPDMFGWEGIIRTINLYKEKKSPGIYKIREGKRGLKIESVESRPYIRMAIVRGIKDRDFLAKSLMTLQEKLDQTIGRKRRKVAIGLHDLDKTEGNFFYKEVKEERFVPLNHEKEMSLKEILENTEQGKKYGNLVGEKKPVIYDEKGVISFPPIINSNRTRVTENTENILVDVTGINEEYVEGVIKIILASLVERGGEIESINVDGRETINMDYIEMEYEKEKIEKLIGMKFQDEEKLFRKMGLIKRGNKVLIPPYRVDFMDYSDLAEELAISYGYENIEEERFKYYQEGEINNKGDIIKEILMSLGFEEVYNFFLNSKKDKEFFGLNENIELENALSEDFNAIRSSLVIGLVRNIGENKKEKLPLKFFEIGRVVDEEEKDKVAFIIADKEIRLEEGMKIINTIMVSYGLDYDIEEGTASFLIKGRTARIKGRGFEGIIGEIHPRINEKYNIDLPMLFCEFTLPP